MHTYFDHIKVMKSLALIIIFFLLKTVSKLFKYYIRILSAKYMIEKLKYIFRVIIVVVGSSIDVELLRIWRAVVYIGQWIVLCSIVLFNYHTLIWVHCWSGMNGFDGYVLFWSYLFSMWCIFRVWSFVDSFWF